MIFFIMELAQAMWHIDLFGHLHAHTSDRELPRFPTQKVGALLALLAFPPAQPYNREDIVAVLWPEAGIEAGRDRLSQALVWLRAQLEPEGTPRGSILIADRRSVGLNPDSIQTDVAAFEEALAQARKSPAPESRIALLKEAVELYKGELLPGFYEDWVLTARERLQEAYRGALEDIALGYERLQELEIAVEYARLALAVDPLREESHYELIRLLSESGQVASALRQYQELEKMLAKDLDTLPSPASRALAEQIRKTNAMTQGDSEHPVSPLRLQPLAIPATLNRFFGRDTEIAHLWRTVQEGVRLVTLIGPGGAGKTRMAIEAAARMVDTYSQAIAFVPLADLGDAQQVPSAIADAFRLSRSAAASPRDHIERIVEALLSVPSFLLILDNMEHLIPDAPPLVRELLLRVPGLTVLVTSRQRLSLEGERELTVPPLSLPPDLAVAPDQLLHSASVQLFVDRAQAVRPGFTVTPANGEAIVQVCERLEGIPLAIELCAAWAQTLTPTQMLERLTRRFDLLVSRRTDISARHRTLRAALEYSYLQLPPTLQRFFADLSVFRGGWSLEAAEAVYGSAIEDTHPLNALTELRERSLIVAEDNGTEMRYRMLETLREFAAEQLTYAEHTENRQRHARFFLELAEQAEEGMLGPEQAQWLNRLDQDQENLRAALGWSAEMGKGETGLRLGSALRRYWYGRGPLSEGYRWLRRLMDMATETSSASIPVSVLAKGWNALGYLAWSEGDYGTAYAAHQQALGLRRSLGDREGIAESLYHLGITTYRQEDFVATRLFLEESLTLAREQNNPAGISRVFLNLGNIAYEELRNAEARSFFEQSLAIEQSLGNRQRVADVSNNLGLVALAEHDYQTAAAFFQDALTPRQEMLDDNGASLALMNLGATARLQGQYARSHTLLIDGLKLAYGVGNKHNIAYNLLQMGLLEAAIGDPSRSVRFLAAAQRLFDVMGSTRGSSYDGEYDLTLDSLRAKLGDTAFDTLWVSGESTLLNQIVAQALNSSENFSSPL